MKPDRWSIILDVIAWALFLLLLFWSVEYEAKGWHFLGRQCGDIAAWWGQRAIQCEQMYWNAIERLKA